MPATYGDAERSSPGCQDARWTGMCHGGGSSVLGYDAGPPVGCLDQTAYQTRSLRRTREVRNARVTRSGGREVLQKLRCG